MNVVIVSETSLCPANSGARLRILGLLKPLAARHRITLLYRATTQAEIEASRAELEPLGVRLVPVLDPPIEKKGMGFYARLAMNVFSPRPYAVTSHDSPGIRREIARLAAEGEDLWQVEWIAYADAVRAIPNAKLIVTAHNVESIIWKRLYDTATGTLRRWYIRQQWQKMEAIERAVYSSVDAAVSCTAEDARRLRELCGAKRVEVVDNGVDVPSHEHLPRTPEPHTVLYVGSLDSRANQDAAVALLREVLPALRAKVPDARLLLVGRAPPEWLTQECQRTPGAEMYADVPDVRPFLSRSSVQAVALRVGGGSRLKILEAFAAGLPLVSTRVGAEGILAEDERELLLVDQPAELVPAIERVWADPEATERRADAGRKLARERYDWSHLAGLLERVWMSVA